MREIMFRGLTWGGKWVYGIPTYLVQENFDNNTIDGIRTCWDINEDVNPETVGQFVGVNDKNGDKIFDGDIIDYGVGRYFPITFKDGRFGIEFSESRHESTWLKLSNFDIVGNIYEHPLLLNKK